MRIANGYSIAVVWMIECFFLLLLAGRIAGGGEMPDRFYALCVGLERSGDQQSLSSSPKDARDMAKALRRASGFPDDQCQVEVMVNDAHDSLDHPTPEHILRRLNLLSEAAGENDRLIFFFVGHGLWVDKDSSAPAATNRGNASMPNERLYLSDIRTIMAGSRARRKLVILDVGDLDVDEVARALAHPDGSSGRAIAWLTSCNTGERTWKDESTGNGLFTRYILEALGSLAEMTQSKQDGWLTIKDLRTHIQEGIALYNRKRLLTSDTRWMNRRQNPQIGLGARRDDPALERLEMFIVHNDVPPPEIILDCGEGAVMRFVHIPAGTYMRGAPDEGLEADIVRKARSEAPREMTFGTLYWEKQHPVTITKPFYIGIVPVTQAQYRGIMITNPSRFKGDDLPVENVFYDDAMEFCLLLSTRTGRNARLPTEAEWEYACRAGATTAFHFGDMIDPDRANYRSDHAYGDGPQGVYREKTTPVGSFSPNAWGLYDMHGNVLELCSDWLRAYKKGEPVIDPTGGEAGNFRVGRGGAWFFDPKDCRSASRFIYNPKGNELRYGFFGFRVVLD